MPDTVFKQLLGRELDPSERPLVDRLLELLRPEWPAPMDPEQPPVPPPNFRPTTTVSSMSLAQPLERLLQLQPALRGQARRVIHGPTRATAEAMTAAGLPVDATATMTPRETNVRGLADTRTKEISVSPGMSPHRTTANLAHELSHLAGRDEMAAGEVSEIMLKLLDRTRRDQAAIDEMMQNGVSRAEAEAMVRARVTPTIHSPSR